MPKDKGKVDSKESQALLASPGNRQYDTMISVAADSAPVSSSADNARQSDSYYGSLIRWGMRNELTLRILLYPVLKTASGHVWLQGPNIPSLKQEASIQTIVSFRDGMRVAFSGVWPAALLSLITHDVIVFYSQSHNRYGNTLLKIALGTSPNQLSWSSHVGTSLVTASKYWLGMGLATALPFLFNTIFNGFWW